MELIKANSSLDISCARTMLLMYPASNRKCRVDNLACFIFFVKRLGLDLSMVLKKSINLRPDERGSEPSTKCGINASRKAISSSEGFDQESYAVVQKNRRSLAS